LQQIDSYLLKITIPNVFSRKPRSLAEHKSWKANELRSWLLYYSVPILKGVLADLYYVHFLLLSAAIYLLTRETVGEEEITTASEYLEDFCTEAEFLYGPTFCTMNVHLLRHLPAVARRWGPLWGFSCFWFESLNGELKKFIHGTRYINTQVASAIRMFQNMPAMLPRILAIDTPSWIKDFVVKLARIPVHEMCEMTDLATGGCDRPNRILVPQQYHHLIDECLSRLGRLASREDSIDQRQRHLKKGQVYVKKSDPRLKDQNGYTIAYQKLQTAIQLFGHIVDIFHVDGLILLAVQKLLVSRDDSVLYYENQTLNKYKQFRPSQLCKVIETDDVDIIDQSEITNKVVYMDIGTNECYIGLINNFIECD
jgi:hypothetical protein